MQLPEKDEKNLEIFYKMYKDNIFKIFRLPNCNFMSYENFKQEILYRLGISKMANIYPNNQFNSDYSYYNYIDFYICFYNFDTYYSKNFNIFPIPIYTVPIPEIANTAFFCPLDYNIGFYLDQDLWKQHYIKVKETLKFIKKYNINLSFEAETLYEDVETLNKKIEIFFDIINPSYKINMEELKKFEFEVQNGIKNTKYKNRVFTSVKGNINYLDKYLSTMREEYKNLTSKIDEVVLLKQEISKSKDFYLTVSGSVMALIALFSGNISLIDKDISIKNIIVFNISIITAILIFSYLFHSIYTGDSKEYGKKFVNILYLFLGLSFVTILVLILL